MKEMDEGQISLYWLHVCGLKSDSEATLWTMFAGQDSASELGCGFQRSVCCSDQDQLSW